METDHQKGDFGGTSGGDGYGSIVRYKAIMIVLVWWLEEGQRLVEGGPNWQWH